MIFTNVSGESEIRTQLAKKLTQEANISWNLGGGFVVTTEDKVTIAATKHLEKMSKEKSWYAPAGVFSTVAITLVTADFKAFLLSADTWIAIYLIVGALALLRLVKDWYAFRKAPTVEEFVAEIKASSPGFESQMTHAPLS